MRQVCAFFAGVGMLSIVLGILFVAQKVDDYAYYKEIEKEYENIDPYDDL